MAAITPIDVRTLDARFEAMEAQRAKLDGLHKRVCTYFCPDRPDWYPGQDAADWTAGVNGAMQDTIGPWCVGVARDGLLHGMASSASKWMEVTLGPNTAPDAKVWLHDTTSVLLEAFEASNLYSELAELFQDQLLVSTGAMLEWDDDDDLFRFEGCPIGSYNLSQNARGHLDGFGRTFTLSPRAAVARFGRERMSPEVQKAFDQQDSGESMRVVIRHLIEANPNEGRGMGAEALPWREVYWEAGTTAKGSAVSQYGSRSFAGAGFDPADGPSAKGPAGRRPLKLGGFHERPFIVGRWARNPRSPWGRMSPAIRALPDVKRLQVIERTGLNALEKGVDPAMLVSADLVDGMNMNPGDVTVDGAYNGSGTGARKLHDIQYAIDHAEAKAEALRERIKAHFYVQIFMMMLSDDRRQPATAEEVVQRRAEGLSVLGPIQTRQGDDVFTPLTARSLGILIRRSMPAWMRGEDGVLPLPPESVRNQATRVRFTGQVAQAMRAQALAPIERHAGFVKGLWEMDQAAADVLDVDQMIRDHAEASGLNPRTTRTRTAVDNRRRARAAEMQAAQAAEAAPNLARAARDLSQSRVGDRSALDVVAA